MTLPLWTVALLTVVPLLCGVVVLRALGIGYRTDRIAYGGWCWLGGSFVVAVATFAWMLAGKPIDGRALAPIVGILAAGAWPLARRRRVLEAASAPTAPRWERVGLGIVIAVIAVTIVVRVLALNVQPVLYGDEANIFAQKAKAMFTVARLDTDYLVRQKVWDVQHIDYPIFDPMLHAWVYAGAGRVTLVDNRLIVQGFAFALLLALAGALRQRVRPGLVALLLLAFFGMEVLDRNIGPSRAELLLLTGLLTAVDSWLRWSATRKLEWWRLACLAVGCTLWAKNEGALLVLSFACAVGFARVVRAVPALSPEPRRALPWLLVPIGVLAMHTAFNAFLDVRNDLFDPSSAGTGLGFWERAQIQLTERFVPVVDYYVRELAFDAAEFRLLIPILLLVAVAWPLRDLVLVPLATVLVALAGYQVVFLATPFPLAEHLQSAADRTVLHTMPVAVLGIAVGWRRSKMTRCADTSPSAAC